MESQPLNPEFRINPENFHPYVMSGSDKTPSSKINKQLYWLKFSFIMYKMMIETMFHLNGKILSLACHKHDFRVNLLSVSYDK